MAQSLKSKQITNMVYGLGASVVLIGALFKILHFQLGFLTGGVMLTIGLLTEAAIFAYSAFEPVDEDLDWTKVYPELGGGASNGNNKQDANVMLSQKLDEMLREAKLDADLMKNLGESINNFKGAAENIAPTVDSIASVNKYNEQMNVAAAQLESLNGLYKLQMENANKQASMNQEMVENTIRLKEQMESLATNLSSLNGVYGGMLSAMSKN